MDNEWLQNLKVGDQVVILNSAFGADDCVAKVERLTATQIVTTRHYRFNRKTGRVVGYGDKYHSPTLVEPTTELINTISQSLLAKKLGLVKWCRLNLDTLRKVMAVLDRKDQ